MLSGHGTTAIQGHDGRKHTFEWGPNAVFAPPLNLAHQYFNGSSREPARLAVCCNLPAVLNLFHSERFVFDNAFTFPEREGAENHFQGEGDFIHVRPGKHMWETNFVPDANDLELQSWAARGGGSSHIQLVLADSILHAHISEMPVGTYKKAHRHGPDLHVFCLSGEGYSLFWYEGDKDYVRVDWGHGWVFAPPDMMFHQHFNASTGRTRYIAIGHGSVRYPFTSQHVEGLQGHRRRREERRQPDRARRPGSAHPPGVCGGDGAARATRCAWNNSRRARRDEESIIEVAKNPDNARPGRCALPGCDCDQRCSAGRRRFLSRQEGRYRRRGWCRRRLRRHRAPGCAAPRPVHTGRAGGDRHQYARRRAASRPPARSTMSRRKTARSSAPSAMRY